MNISELARRLRTTPDELREKMPILGFDVGHRAIKVDDRLVDKIMQKWSEAMKLERLRAKYKREEAVKEAAIAKVKKVLLPKVITVRDFSNKLSLPLNIVISELMKNGILASLNERIDFETASIIADDLGYEVGREEDTSAAIEDGSISAERVKEMTAGESEENLVVRAPVVVVMGHVDHGKTALLDAIRKTDVAKGEAGGITQHIGAYQKEKKGRKITFIDTPGHEAFTVMRSRGARIADVGVLVVALDDGVQPQTVEVIKILNAAKLPFVVALNKADKPDADLQRVKTQLSEQGLIPEDWGGKTPMVQVSAKTGKGLDELLDMILLVADMDKDKIRANPDRHAVGSIIESHVDKGEGPVATVLVQAGTLRRNDILSVGGQLYGRVRAMKDWNGQSVDEAGPSMPVKILGFKSTPQVGDVCEVPADAGDMKKVRKQYAVDKQVVATSMVSDSGEVKDKKMVNVVLKCDVLGSLEAIMGTIEKLQTQEVGVAVVGKGLGNVTDGDIIRAETTGALLVGFNVQATREAQILARDKKVKINLYRIIYEIFDEIKKRMQDLLPSEVITTQLGKLEVLAIFRADKTGQIIGGRVTDGHLESGANCVVYRGQDPIGDGSIIQLQAGKTEVKEVRGGQECGLKVSVRPAILVGDIVEVFRQEKKERKLTFVK